MEQKLKWEEFWNIYEIVTGMKPKHKKEFEEEVENAKRELIKLFGGTKIEIESNAEISTEEIREEINSYLNNLWERMQKKEEIPEKIMTDIHETMLVFLEFDVAPEDLAAGYISEKSYIIKALNGAVQPGMKIAKALRIMLKDRGQEQYSDFLIQDLSILQGKLKSTNKKTKIVVSLDPLDFLLASNVTTGWKTCHSIISGTHAAGNLSYLADKHTAIAYAYKEFGEYLDIKVPRKIWRQWVFIDVENAIALFQKQYPTEIEQYSKNARSIVGNALAKYHNIEANWTKAKWNSNKDTIYYSNIAEIAYSDPTDTYIYFKNLSPSKEDWKIPVGEPPVCPVCGGEIDVSSELYCSNCAGYVRCSECGEWVSEDEAYYGADSELYCEECFNKHFVSCAECGKIIWKEDAYYNPDGDYVCETCFNERYVVCDACGSVVWRDEAYEVNFEVYCDECFHKYFVACSNCDSPIDKDSALTDVYGNYVCEFCAESDYVTCEICGELVKIDDAEYIDDDTYVCEYCFREHYTICRECDTAIEKDKAYYTDEGVPLCEDCYIEWRAEQKQKEGSAV